jgi:hypothetical protein
MSERMMLNEREGNDLILQVPAQDNADNSREPEDAIDSPVGSTRSHAMPNTVLRPTAEKREA